MKKLLLFVFTLLSLFAISQPTLTTYDTTITGTGTGSGTAFNVRITRSTNHWSEDSVQAIIFVVGLGEMSTDPSKMVVHGPHAALLNGGWDGSTVLGNGTHYPIIITIQPRSYPFAVPTYMKTKIDALLGRFKIKRSSVHLTGLSQGGWSSNLFVTYQATAGDYSYARMIASVVNVQGVVPSDSYGATPAYPTRFRYWALYGHGGTGGVECGFEQSQDFRGIKELIDTMNAARPGSGYFQQTNYGDGKHNSFEQWYGGSNAPVDTFPITAGINYGERQNIYKWMLRQGDTINTYHFSTTNLSPVANAGSDQSITLPTDSITLMGSATDADGTIISYAWTKISGPSSFTITSPDSALTTITGLVQGTYVFRLTAEDDDNATGSDDVQVTVNSNVLVTKYVNVNIYGGSNPYSDVAWNDWNVGSSAGSNINSGSLTYSDGTASSISAVLSASAAISENGATYAGGMAPGEVLRYASYTISSRTLTITGLDTARTYNLELYASRNANTYDSTEFIINGERDTIITYRNHTNKSEFSNITPTSPGQIVVNINPLRVYDYLNGFGLTENGDSSSSFARGAGATTLQAPKAKTELVLDREELNITPNPINDAFTLQLNNEKKGPIKIQVIDMNGKVIKTFKFEKGQSRFTSVLRLNNILTGNYIIQVQIGNWRKTISVLKL